MINMDEVPVLEGWLTVPEVAEALKVSRQYAYKQVQSGVFDTVHRIGQGDRPIYVVAATEVEAKLKSKTG